MTVQEDLAKGIGLSKPKNRVDALIKLLEKGDIETKTILRANQIKSICYAKFKSMCNSTDDNIKNLSVYEKWDKIIEDFLVLNVSLDGWRSKQIVEGLGRIQEEDTEKPMVTITGQKV